MATQFNQKNNRRNYDTDQRGAGYQGMARSAIVQSLTNEELYSEIYARQTRYAPQSLSIQAERSPEQVRDLQTAPSLPSERDDPSEEGFLAFRWPLHESDELFTSFSTPKNSRLTSAPRDNGPDLGPRMSDVDMRVLVPSRNDAPVPLSGFDQPTPMNRPLDLVRGGRGRVFRGRGVNHRGGSGHQDFDGSQQQRLVRGDPPMRGVHTRFPPIPVHDRFNPTASSVSHQSNNTWPRGQNFGRGGRGRHDWIPDCRQSTADRFDDSFPQESQYEEETPVTDNYRCRHRDFPPYDFSADSFDNQDQWQGDAHQQNDWNMENDDVQFENADIDCLDFDGGECYGPVGLPPQRDVGRFRGGGPSFNHGWQPDNGPPPLLGLRNPNMPFYPRRREPREANDVTFQQDFFEDLEPVTRSARFHDNWFVQNCRFARYPRRAIGSARPNFRAARQHSKRLGTARRLLGLATQIGQFSNVRRLRRLNYPRGRILRTRGKRRGQFRRPGDVCEFELPPALEDWDAEPPAPPVDFESILKNWPKNRIANSMPKRKRKPGAEEQTDVKKPVKFRAASAEVIDVIDEEEMEKSGNRVKSEMDDEESEVQFLPDQDDDCREISNAPNTEFLIELSASDGDDSESCEIVSNCPAERLLDDEEAAAAGQIYNFRRYFDGIESVEGVLGSDDSRASFSSDFSRAYASQDAAVYNYEFRDDASQDAVGDIDEFPDHASQNAVLDDDEFPDHVSQNAVLDNDDFLDDASQDAAVDNDEFPDDASQDAVVDNDELQDAQVHDDESRAGREMFNEDNSGEELHRGNPRNARLAYGRQDLPTNYDADSGSDDESVCELDLVNIHPEPDCPEELLEIDNCPGALPIPTGNNRANAPDQTRRRVYNGPAPPGIAAPTAPQNFVWGAGRPRSYRPPRQNFSRNFNKRSHLIKIHPQSPSFGILRQEFSDD